MNSTRTVKLFTHDYPSGRCAQLCKAFHDLVGMEPDEALRSGQRLFDNQHSQSDPMTLDIPEQHLDTLTSLCKEFGIRVE